MPDDIEALGLRRRHDQRLNTERDRECRLSQDGDVMDASPCFPSTIRALLPVQTLTIELHEAGLVLAERYGLSINDAMIAASVLDADCDTLWSEDMQDGFVWSGVTIVNPFAKSRHPLLETLLNQ